MRYGFIAYNILLYFRKELQRVSTSAIEQLVIR